MKSFSKKINEDTIKMVVTDDSKRNITYWTINLYKNQTDSILLDKFEYPEIYEAEPNILKGDIRLKIILGDAIIRENIVYLALYNFGKVTFNIYHIDEGQVFKTEHFVSDEVLLSYMNFGEPQFYAKIIHLNDKKIVIYTDKNKLLVFDKLERKVKKIILTEKSRLKEDEKYFRDFNIQKNHSKVGDIIHEIVNQTKEGNLENFDYKGYIDDINTITDIESSGIRDTGMTYFFYKADDNTHILQYDNYEYEWILTDYKEEEIKQETIKE